MQTHAGLQATPNTKHLLLLLVCTGDKEICLLYVTWPGLLGVPFRAESSSDDAMLTKPVSEEAATPAEGVTGADSSVSHLGYTWVWPPLIQCKGLFLLAAARDMPDPTFCIKT